MPQLPPMLVRAIAAVEMDVNSRAAVNTLLHWAFGLDGTLAVTGLAKIANVLEALDRIELAAGETEPQRQKIRATIVERIG